MRRLLVLIAVVALLSFIGGAIVAQQQPEQLKQQPAVDQPVNQPDEPTPDAKALQLTVEEFLEKVLKGPHIKEEFVGARFEITGLYFNYLREVDWADGVRIYCRRGPGTFAPMMIFLFLQKEEAKKARSLKDGDIITVRASLSFGNTVEGIRFDNEEGLSVLVHVHKEGNP